MNGILIVDKPSDWTSHDVVAKLRGALKIRRIGHGGTLDPMATGVLPVFVGRATRAAEFCENAEKEYIAELRLGIVTDSQDTTGNILTECVANVSEKEVSDVLASFLGPQKQIPPMYSAIKKDGKKLYELARKGIEVERPARDITIFAIELLDSGDNGRDFKLRIACSKGTYIRTICHDIGAKLGVGGVMSGLRRTRAGIFTIDNAAGLDEIVSSAALGDVSSLLLPADSFFAELPVVTLSERDTQKTKNGASLSISQPDGRYRFYSPCGEFLMLGSVLNGKSKIIKSFFDPMLTDK